MKFQRGDLLTGSEFWQIVDVDGDAITLERGRMDGRAEKPITMTTAEVRELARRIGAHHGRPYIHGPQRSDAGAERLPTPEIGAKIGTRADDD